MPAKLICDYDAVLADARAGMLYRDIARKYGISQQTASRIAREGGLVRKPQKKMERTAVGKPGRHDPYWPFWFKDEWDYWRRVVLKYGKSTKT